MSVFACTVCAGAHASVPVSVCLWLRRRMVLQRVGEVCETIRDTMAGFVHFLRAPRCLAVQGEVVRLTEHVDMLQHEVIPMHT